VTDIPSDTNHATVASYTLREGDLA